MRVLSPACLVLITYLTGCRPGEVLNLRRGCPRRNTTTQLWEIHGRKWKNARDENGAKISEGQYRDEPWIAPDLVATAVTVQERLHDGDVLFPAWLVVDGPHPRAGEARNLTSANDDLNRFVEWVNGFCHRHRRTDVIPPHSKRKRLTMSRLRRTLCGSFTAARADWLPARFSTAICTSGSPRAMRARTRPGSPTISRSSGG